MVILVAWRSSLNVVSTMDGSGSSKVRVIYPPASMPAIILPFTLSVSMFIGKILYVHPRHMGTRQVSGTTMIWSNKFTVKQHTTLSRTPCCFALSIATTKRSKSFWQIHGENLFLAEIHQSAINWSCRGAIASNTSGYRILHQLPYNNKLSIDD